MGKCLNICTKHPERSRRIALVNEAETSAGIASFDFAQDAYFPAQDAYIFTQMLTPLLRMLRLRRSLAFTHWKAHIEPRVTIMDLASDTSSHVRTQIGRRVAHIINCDVAVQQAGFGELIDKRT